MPISFLECHRNCLDDVSGCIFVVCFFFYILSDFFDKVEMHKILFQEKLNFILGIKISVFSSRISDC